MSGRRNIIIAVGAIVLLAAVVGFYITLDVSPQIAYARLFIDVGLCIALVAVILAFYKEPRLNTEPLVQAIKSLHAGKYTTRIALSEGPLGDLSAALNELAKYLESHHNKQEEMKRNLREELLPGMKLNKEITHNFEHSFHPELGPVYGVLAESKSETKFENSLVESTPPDAPQLSLESDNSLDSQDLGELYQRFIDAQREINIRQIEYPVFLKTIEQSRAALMNSHTCKDILFDIVKEQNQVALQPRIVR